ncbi:phage gp6-like head-tail connector protein [Cohnella cholangitidis]|uniref:Phage gp6-like head-tail connector protein n=1 Tax=Cohnella cholangitidis TaxID=2598458 RepID=A0A7G5C3F3_9BACL|nr:phage gp6-like head-tail connector protein [Cohnella cholangitidis]QMV43737.1 phage gp6-like head-tail connector protein [Cohnella cholangitidis]
MSDAELLAKVKAGLGLSGTHNDVTLTVKTIAVKEFMLNAGVSQAQIESSLGIASLTLGVSDLWNIAPGEVKFSDAFLYILMPQLMAVSMPDA